MQRSEGFQANKKILVVDDEPKALASLQRILSGAGYQVTCMRDLRSARTCLAGGEFHLVLSDLYLEDGELGYDVAEAARNCDPPIPVVLLTAHPSFNGAQEAIRSHVCEIVVKPIDALELVSTCRRSIRNAETERRNLQLEAQNQVLAQVLPLAIEAKDPTTCGHSERVVRYTDTLARRCGVSETDRRHLRMASLLHDVGKIGIPETILAKEGPLTKAEREIINRHPELGREILKPLVDGERIRTWVYQHHERWDGKGYPEGLGGEEVDLPGRILILAEVYDALAEARSYKPAWENERIVGFFRQEGGRHFDPDLAHLVASGLEKSEKRFFCVDPGMLF